MRGQSVLFVFLGFTSAWTPAWDWSKCTNEDMQQYRAAADDGDAEGFNQLAVCTLQTDEKSAFKLMKQAAKLGLATAQNNLGFCFASGLGHAKNEQKAFKWYLRAADQGNSEVSVGIYVYPS
jgi:TPR repeat protein